MRSLRLLRLLSCLVVPGLIAGSLIVPQVAAAQSTNDIVVLSVQTNGTDGSFTVSGVYWLAVPANNQIPLPGFQSLAPFVSTSTLAALRAGTVLEQPFTTPLFASGTSLASVQSSLVTAFGVAQAAENSAAAALSGLVASQYTGSSWTASTPSLVVFDPSSKIQVTIGWVAAASLIPGVSAGRATGYVATSAIANTAIMATPYTAPGVNGQRSLVSSSASDAAAGTGAQQITITYLDASFALHTEVDTLNGTTAVNTVNSNIAYVESMLVTQVGSGGTNVGTITMKSATGGGGSTVGSIAVDGSNQTNWAHHYVPAGVTCYLLTYDIASYGVMGTGYLARTGNPSATNLPLIQIGPTQMHPLGDQREHVFQSALPIVGPDLIVEYSRPVASTADTSLGNFEWIQF